MIRLLLASASPARRATLTAAGLAPLVAVSGVDEDAVLAAARERFGDLEPADAVLVLAQAKAEDVARRLDEIDVDGWGDDEDVVVLGCDSMLEIDGAVLGKPADADDAVARWHAMRGRTGTLHTGHWLVDERDPADGGTRATLGATASTVVHFADLSDAEVSAYVATREPLAVAGAFTVDGLGGPFVERIEGDHHNVVGVSLPLLRHLLAEIDLTIPTFWRP
ncbi:Maf family protein [Cellulomonas sp. S1-8]|uniref:Maf family protein n=1 Tax=Cellulomonas sp. S1-8 TaxID=2904790 RepID=UPI002242F31F|nr:nucleoside triphosphate pyrophosphatase [Cellulomonas sp. S1-8]UZN04425.1 Maf family nucleotide pyrophosphatase [Cellulomonas sp. S1-8]